MIKPNELRKGNLILVDFGLPGLQLHEVRGQDIADIENGKITLSAMQPIPLTTQWLERMGFEKDQDQPLEPVASGYSLRLKVGDNANVICASLLHQDTELRKQGTRAFYTVNVHWGSNNMLYVHQLQNLYFALTGKELTIKETV